MKKILLPLLLLMACSKNSDTTKNNKDQEIWVSGYTAFSSSSQYKKNNVVFNFFPANNGESYTEDKKSNTGGYSSFQTLNDDIFNLIKSNKHRTKSGVIVNSIKTILAAEGNSQYESFLLPAGKYYLTAHHPNIDVLGVKSEYSLKYTGRFIEVFSQAKPMDISVVIPGGTERYGFFDWVSWNEKFSYKFNE